MGKQEDNIKTPVTLTQEQIGGIDSYIGILGNTRSEVIRYIVANWLIERGKR